MLFQLEPDFVSLRHYNTVTFPRGWRGRWDVHSMLRKRYAFFDGKGMRVDEASDRCVCTNISHLAIVCDTRVARTLQSDCLLMQNNPVSIHPYICLG